MSKIKVNLLEFYCIFVNHVEIVLEKESESGTLYYNIDRWKYPVNRAIRDDEESLEMLKRADKKLSFYIEGDMDKIIDAWEIKFKANKENFCCNNCADTSAWFLDTFCNIPNPGSCSKPFTYNYVFCGFFSPSFFQCCTIPGRVFDYTKEKVQQREPSANITLKK